MYNQGIGIALEECNSRL